MFAKLTTLALGAALPGPATASAAQRPAAAPARRSRID
jgi:hypothetical protein